LSLHTPLLHNVPASFPHMLIYTLAIFNGALLETLCPHSVPLEGPPSQDVVLPPARGVCKYHHMFCSVFASILAFLHFVFETSFSLGCCNSVPDFGHYVGRWPEPVDAATTLGHTSWPLVPPNCHMPGPFTMQLGSARGPCLSFLSIALLVHMHMTRIAQPSVDRVSKTAVPCVSTACCPSSLTNLR
jgi:hypothetical protein